MNHYNTFSCKPVRRLLHLSGKLVCAGMLLLATVAGHAQVRKYSNEFLAIGVGGRAFGMGGAQVATVNDVTAGYWNPAGLTHGQSDLQVGLMHAEYFAGIAKYDYGAVTMPIGDGDDRFLGLSLIRFGVDDIPNTLHMVEPDGSINYNKVFSFSAADYAFLVSYAQKIKDVEGLSIGGNAKVIHRNVGPFARAWGIGMDIGAQYAYRNWRFGVMGHDITTTFNAWSYSFTDEEKDILLREGNEVPTNSLEITPPRIVFGTAYMQRFWEDRISVMPELNLAVTTDGRRNVLISGDPFSVDPLLGVELGYADIIFVRGGIKNVQYVTDDFGEEITIMQPNIGLGLRIKSFQIDYALTDVGDLSYSLYSHVFSLRVDINKPTDE